MADDPSIEHLPSSGVFLTILKICMRVALLPLIVGWLICTATAEFMRFRPNWRYWRAHNENPLELLGIRLWEKPDGSAKMDWESYK